MLLDAIIYMWRDIKIHFLHCEYLISLAILV